MTLKHSLFWYKVCSSRRRALYLLSGLGLFFNFNLKFSLLGWRLIFLSWIFHKSYNFQQPSPAIYECQFCGVFITIFQLHGPLWLLPSLQWLLHKSQKMQFSGSNQPWLLRSVQSEWSDQYTSVACWRLWQQTVRVHFWICNLGEMQM